MKRSFIASFNRCQPSEAKRWSKNAFFHILTAVNMRNLKIGSFPEKTKCVTLYNDVTSCQKSEETNDAFSSKC